VFMGDMLTGMIEAIVSEKGRVSAEEEMMKLGVARLPDIKRDTTDRNRTSPFAFTGNKFEFRAVGSSQSIAFPVALLNAAVAEAIGELTVELREELKKTRKVDDAVLKVVRHAFKETTPIRFEGNNYSDEWVTEAAKRGLPNYRRSPEALAQLVTKSSKKCLVGLGILTEEELDSRYHVRLERYIKDLMIELHTLREMVDTMVLPAAFNYSGSLIDAASKAKAARVTVVPQTEAANALGKLIRTLQRERATLEKVIAKAESMHESLERCAAYLTKDGAAALASVRAACDAIEVMVDDECWPLPKYREMLFPV
jgi:glutamine synthetase